MKNFGNTRWNEPEFETDEDIEVDDSMGLLDGNADDDTKLMKIEMMDSL
jgi:hypothetical protein